MANTSVFRDLVERLLQEHESLSSRYDELLSKHRSLLGGGDGHLSRPTPSLHQLGHPCEAQHFPGRERCPEKNERIEALNALASLMEKGNGEGESAPDASAQFASDIRAMTGPQRTISLKPSVPEDNPVYSAQVGGFAELRASGSDMTVAKTSLNEKLYPEWALSADDVTNAVSRASVTDEDLRDVTGSMALLHIHDSQEQSKKASGCQRIILEPNCRRKMWWDVIGMMCLLWDFFVIPMMVFGIDEARFTVIMSIVLAFFWTADTVLSFFVGFYDSGRIVLSPKKICVRYLKSWFLVDLSLVTIDWTVIFLQFVSASNGYFDVLRFGRTWRFVRFIRVIRLLRVLKAKEMIQELQDLIRSEVVQTIVIIVKLVVGVFMINHILACAWYWIGSMGPTEDNWIHHLKVDMDTAISSDITYHYLSSLHWSLTQFMPASMEVVPHNQWERLFAIFAIILGLVVFSSFLSSITAAMTHLRQIKLKQTKTRVAIRRFSIDNNLSSELSLQIHRFARVHHIKSDRILIGDLHFVKFLPESLRIRMHSEVYLPRLSKHPLFERWVYSDLPGLVKVCHTAMGERSLLAGEELFNIGESCRTMYMPLTGNLRYFYYDLNSAGDAIIEINGSEAEQKRISEMVLWTPWEHRGRLVAMSSSFVFSLDSAKFRGIVKARRAFVGPAVSYARSYVLEIVRAFDGNSAGVLDVWDDTATVEKMAYDAFQAMEVDMTMPMQRTSSNLFGKLSQNITKMLHKRKDSA